VNHRLSSRRDWLQTVAAASLVPVLPGLASTTRAGRDFHVCLAPPIVTSDEELVETVRQAGVSTVWLAGFLYGNKPYTDELIQRAHAVVERAGMRPELITVPLGHPGNSLGLPDGNSPPSHWHSARRPDGKEFVGTSIHPPATAENCDALHHLKPFGFRQCFVDDDFRLARGPGEIGGCFCADHQARFLKGGGYFPRRWTELLQDVQARRLTPLLRAWLEFTGKELTSSFRAQQRAFRGELGIMVMYLGAEKAGIRLGDYRNALFRVGELMFDDGSFGSVKGKTDELFSVLFHRRFAEPSRAFSETTAYPADRLSAANMAAKLVISTIADVRHTMFMSGLTPFPRAHWATLAPAMKRQAALHELVAGHKPGGPFKHLWGEAQRLVGDDRPFSLWLASGVPFEVVERPASDGWNFASDFDASEAAAQRRKGHVRWVCRGSATQRPEGAEVLGESLPEIFAFKHRIQDHLKGVPHVAEDHPAVCAWYPTARRALVWNLADEPCRLTVKDGEHRHELSLGPLAAESVVLG
jgi:hypothetical protein